jgi:hypothetical protein
MLEARVNLIRCCAECPEWGVSSCQSAAAPSNHAAEPLAACEASSASSSFPTIESIRSGSFDLDVDLALHAQALPGELGADAVDRVVERQRGRPRSCRRVEDIISVGECYEKEAGGQITFT